MNLPNTNASISNGSRNSALERPLNQFLLLGALGLSLAGIHEAWDLSLGLPGHFGLVWMASLICARAGSSLRFAALTTAIAYAGGASAFSGGTHSLFGHGPGYVVAAQGASKIDFRTSSLECSRVEHWGCAGELAPPLIGFGPPIILSVPEPGMAIALAVGMVFSAVLAQTRRRGRPLL